MIKVLPLPSAFGSFFFTHLSALFCLIVIPDIIPPIPFHTLLSRKES